METKELIQLKSLLEKYLSKTEGVTGIESIKPCLKMVKEQLILIKEGYILK